VVLEDAFGQPAIAPSDVVVQLASSRTAIASVNSSVTIPAGQTYALTGVKTGLSPSTANLTAAASGYASSSTTLGTVLPAPLKLAAYVSPSSTIAVSSGNVALLAVQLQDINGFPAKASQDTTIVVPT
jgi:hypothetical protein